VVSVVFDLCQVELQSVEVLELRSVKVTTGPY
jgi:hypothetical protein